MSSSSALIIPRKGETDMFDTLLPYLLAGISLDYREKGFGGIRDYLRLVRRMSKEASHE